MKTILIFALALLSACTHPLIGVSAPSYEQHSCTNTNACLFKFNNQQFIVRYTLKPTEAGSYRLKGSATVDVSAISAVYEKIDNLKITIAMVDKDTVVHTKLILLHGDNNKAILFDKEITVPVDFDASIVVNLHAIIGG